MIRPFTCVCALLAGASGLYLYTEKHRTTVLDQQISGIVSQTQQIRERTAMLRAEWALLNQPDRLQGLATRFLPQLQPMAPTQFVQMAELDKHLAAPGPETPTRPIVTPQTAPSLVGQKPTTPALAPAADGAAIAQAAPPDTALTGPKAPTELAMAHPAPHGVAPRLAGHHDVQLADATDPAAASARHAPALRAPALRAPALRAPALRSSVQHDARKAAHAVAPVRFAAYAAPHAGRPAISAGASYSRPQVLAAAAWRPAPSQGQASWPAPRPASYAAPESMSALGSSLGGRNALPAPVPLSDGN